ncbi:phosphotransferase system, enzyme I, PtsP [Oceanospirillum multiglobuliferum]|uniref:phosphoenolpyruvate--protein phosphotransferase n=1 Tax=Oceanospirillum multiglobuliferum TaxID=64969 RepID=UPI00099A86B6|nr:phosphoenolpyruvate--protein phosphotransferase [Oceanospirillum multiglobuliferum]SKA27225.1 phosphotransferase system, enzyme I, PtsP [Oceanospirillum multiglobuliferum]
MLKTLQRIVQEVNSARNLDETLSIIVRKVKRAMKTDVCSVYLFDNNSQRYILMDSVGLKKESIKQVSLSAGQGLVGYVGLREEPVNLDDATQHPNYVYFAETGEERFHSFLGVPIIHQRRILGVIVVQEQAKRRFDEGEEAFLITISAQLAGLLAHSLATGSSNRSDPRLSQIHGSCFRGVAGTSGIAIGTAVVVLPVANLESVPDRPAEDIEQEITQFNEALAAVRYDIHEVNRRLAQRLSEEERALFDAYQGMLDDSALGHEVNNKIREGNWAQGALCQVVTRHARFFELSEDDYLKERASDIRDLGRRVLGYLQKAEQQYIEYPSQAILVSQEVTPAMLGEIPKEKLVGLVSVQGSSNSHVAILARAMGIPAVMGTIDLPVAVLDGQQLIVDSYQGVVFNSPSDELLIQYGQLIQAEEKLLKGLEHIAGLPCETLDGHKIPLLVNTGLAQDITHSLNHGAEGVGLFRTEVPFMISERFPSESEQQKVYRAQLEAFYPQPVVMRTLDIGGDKALPYFPINEANPFLGWRGIRVTLDHPEVFLVQVRAMLRASEDLDNLQIMLPMVSNVPEVTETISLIERAWHELCQEGLNIQRPDIGVMIEVPGAIYQVAQIAKYVDFLSVGSNDLTQYLLAVDRNNPRVASLYSSFHPAVLAALNAIAEAAKQTDCRLGLCGELAGDPRGAILLMAMGYNSLSMNAVNLPRVKSAIRSLHRRDAVQLLDSVLNLETAEQVLEQISLTMEDLGLKQLLQPSLLD